MDIFYCQLGETAVQEEFGKVFFQNNKVMNTERFAIKCVDYCWVNNSYFPLECFRN